MEKLKIALIFTTISSMFMAAAAIYAEQIPDNHTEISWFNVISQGEQNLVTLHFYVQNIGSGPNATSFPVATASVTPHSPTKFGQVLVMDDKLTVGPELDSAEVGHLQAFVVSSDMRNMTNSGTLNFFFTSGKYHGSTITVVGRNAIGEKQRELPVVGGTGAFRFCRGYVITTTYLYDEVEDRTVLDYWIHVTSAE